jgi:hypothetical protein
MFAGELEEETDDLIFHHAQTLGAAPSMPILQQQPFGERAPLGQHGFEQMSDRSAQRLLVAGMELRQSIELGRRGARVE